MEVSIGIMAYNEEKNIGRLLNSIFNQKLKKIKIKEIIVVSSGSSDKTNEIVKNFIKKNKKIRLIIQKEREGKFSAINEFLKIAKSKILILLSSDIFLRVDAIEKLCIPLFKKEVGIVASHPIPIINKKSILNLIVALQWRLHHRVSLIQPKFGEAIAFRNEINKISYTAVDEEFIAMRIMRLGYNGYYADNAIVYNNSPSRISGHINQKSRYYWGHLELMKKYNYKVASLNSKYTIRGLIKELSFSTISIIIFAVILELYARFLARLDIYRNKNYYKWKIVKCNTFSDSSLRIGQYGHK